MNQDLYFKKVIAMMDDKGHDISEITEETELRDFMDSLDKVEIGMEIERQFDITLPSDTEFEWRTVGDIVNSIIDIKSNS